MDIDSIRYFNDNKKLVISEYETVFGRSIQFTKPDPLLSRFIVPLNFRVTQSEFNTASDVSKKELFKTQILESFEEHKTDEMWIKELLPTIIALQSINKNMCFSDTIAKLEALFKKYTQAHPLSDESSEFIKKHQAYILENIKKDETMFRFAHDSLKTDLEFLFKAWQSNPSSFYKFDKDMQWALIKAYPVILEKDPDVSEILIWVDKDRLIDLIKEVFALNPKVLSGINDRAFYLFLEKYPDLIESVSKVRTLSESQFRELAFNNSENLKYFPYDFALKWVLKNPKDFCKMSEKLRNDKRFNLELVGLNGDILNFLTTFKNDPDIVIAAITQNKGSWKYVTDLGSDVKFVTSLVQKKILPYDEIVKYKAVKEIVFAACKHHPQILELADSFQHDRDFILACVRQNGRCLQYAKNFQKDEDIVLAAIDQNAQALIFASDELRNNEAFVLKAVHQNGLALEYAKEYRKDKEFVLKAVKENPEAFLYAPKNIKEKPDFLQILFAAELHSESAEKRDEIVLEASKLVTKETSYSALLSFIQSLRKVPPEISMSEMIIKLQGQVPIKMDLPHFAEIIEAFLEVPEESKELSFKILGEIKNWNLAHDDFVTESKKILGHIDSLAKVIPVPISDEDFAIVVKKFLDVPESFFELNCEIILSLLKEEASDSFYLQALKELTLITKQDLSKLAIFASGSSLTLKSGWKIDVEGSYGLFNSFIIPHICARVGYSFLKKAEATENHAQKERYMHMHGEFLKLRESLSLKANIESFVKTIIYIAHIEEKSSLDLDPVMGALLDGFEKLKSGESFLIPISFSPPQDSSSSRARLGHAVLMEICKQDDGNYRIIIYDTALLSMFAKIEGSSGKIYPFVVKDIDKSLLNESFFQELIKKCMPFSELELGAQFRNFYTSLEKMGTRADEEEKPFNRQGGIDNCAYKCVSKFLHKQLGSDYEFAKVCIHRKILSILKESMNAFYRSAFETKDRAFKDQLLRALYLDKKVIKEGSSIQIWDDSLRFKELSDDEFMLYAALLLESEIKKTEGKLSLEDRALLED
jgi:hypothetical protein